MERNLRLDWQALIQEAVHCRKRLGLHPGATRGVMRGQQTHPQSL